MRLCIKYLVASVDSNRTHNNYASINILILALFSFLGHSQNVSLKNNYLWVVGGDGTP